MADMTELTLADAAANLEHVVAWLKRQYEHQLRIDPNWTTLELEAEQAKSLIGGLEALAAVVCRKTDNVPVPS